jgi:hypothetical protein
MLAQPIIWFVILCVPGIIPAAIFYSRHCNQTPENRFPLGLYVVALLTCAFVAFWAGVGLGVEYACSKPSWGNLCGLLGVFVVGPLSSFIAVTVASWLMTYFPLQMKPIAPIGVVLILLGVGYHYRYDFRSFFLHEVMHQPDLLRYRLQSDNVDDLHRYVPLIEAKMRELAILKDVSLDSQLTSEQAFLGVDPQKPRVAITKQLPTMAITFGRAPNVTHGDALAQIHDMQTRLALPATIITSFVAGQMRRSFDQPD